MACARSRSQLTDPGVFEVLVDCWRSLSIAERVALVDQLNADVELLAVPGIRRSHPDLSQVDVRHALATRRFGAALADEAYAQQLA